MESQQVKVSEIDRRKVEKISQQLLDRVIKTYERELLNSYNFNINENNLSVNQKQTQLIILVSSIVIALIGTSIFLALITKQRNPKITWSKTGLCFLPEECVAELETIHEILKSSSENNWKIRLIMLWNILTLLAAIHIQVSIEDLFLPQQNKRY